MRFDIDDKHLNVFRYYREPFDFENNITRALICCMTRSEQRYAVTTEVLRMIADDDKLKNQEEGEQKISSILRNPTAISANLQQEVTEWDRKTEGAEDMYPVLLLLEPQKPQDLDADAQEGKSRSDAVLTVSSGERGVFLVIENKKCGSAKDRQLAKYKDNLGSRLITLHMEWKTLFDRMSGLASDIGEGDQILSDFLKIIARNPKLAGFTGLTMDHLEDAGSSRTKNVIRALTEECTSGDAAESPVDRVGKEFSRSSSMDIDLYLPDAEQTLCMGNIGIRVSSDGEFQCKLIIGDFKYDPSPEDGVAGQANYETHHGTCDLCENWDTRKKLALRKWNELAECEGKLEMRVRARRRRVQHIKHYSVLCQNGAEVDLSEAVELLNKLQPDDRGREITKKEFERVANLMNERGKAEWKEDRDSLISGHRYLTGSLHVFRTWSAVEFLNQAGKVPEQQIRFVRDKLGEMADLLRAMSGI